MVRRSGGAGQPRSVTSRDYLSVIKCAGEPAYASSEYKSRRQFLKVGMPWDHPVTLKQLPRDTIPIGIKFDYFILHRSFREKLFLCVAKC